MVESRCEESSSSTTRKRLFCEASFSDDNGPDKERGGDQKMNIHLADSEGENHSSSFQLSGFMEVEKHHHQEDYTSSRFFCEETTAPNVGNGDNDIKNGTARDGKGMQTGLSQSALVSLEKAVTTNQKGGIDASTSVTALSAMSVYEKKQLIRVFLRLRPLQFSLLPSPPLQPSRSLEVLSHTKVQTLQPTGNQTLRLQKHSEAYAKVYNFDGVYDETVTQMETYDSIAKDLVQNVAHGVSCVLFSYGATNSGKTHSIFGAEGWGACQSEDAIELEGILPRALRELLRLSEGSQAKDTTSTYVFVSLFEIYREKIYDLMVKRDRKTLKLERLNRDKSTWKVAGLHWLNASEVGVTETIRRLYHGTQRRHRGNNGLNATSSRSHCMCQIELRRESVTLTSHSSGMASEGSGKNNNSTLRIIDLAGSERASKTTFEGGDFFQRRQEAININKTMLTLWQCLRGMQQRRSCLQPSLSGIRESTLTKWICPYLFDSRPGTTVVLVSASPGANCYDETQHVLDNATTASKIRIQSTAVMPDAMQTGGEGSKCPGQQQQQQLYQHERKRWNTSTSVDSVITSQAYCQQHVKRQRPFTTAEGDDACLVTELHELKLKLLDLKSENDVLSNELHEIKAKWKEKEATILSEVMEQHEIAIRGEVAEEIEVIMGDMASEIKSLKRQVQEPMSSLHAHTAVSTTRRENAHRLKTYIQDREEQVEECEAEMERMRQSHADEMNLLREELNLTKRRLKTLLLVNNSEECDIEPLNRNVNVSFPTPVRDGLVTTQKYDVLIETNSAQVYAAAADDESIPIQKMMHSESLLADTENDSRESVSENSIGISRQCSPLTVTETATETATTTATESEIEIPSLGPDLVGCEVMLQQEPNLWKLGKITAYRPRARRLKFEITFSEGVSDVAKRERCKFIELRQDTYGFEEDDVWHLLKQQSCPHQRIIDPVVPSPPVPLHPKNSANQSSTNVASSLLSASCRGGGRRRRLMAHQPLAHLGASNTKKQTGNGGMEHPRVGLDLDCTPPRGEKTLAGKLMNKERFRGTVATKFLR